MIYSVISKIDMFVHHDLKSQETSFSPSYIGEKFARCWGISCFTQMMQLMCAALPLSMIFQNSKLL